MKNFIKGFFVGIANITPGISGSALLVSLNLYEKCINSISNIFKDFKSNFKFLFPILLIYSPSTMLLDELFCIHFLFYHLGIAYILVLMKYQNDQAFPERSQDLRHC